MRNDVRLGWHFDFYFPRSHLSDDDIYKGRDMDQSFNYANVRSFEMGRAAAAAIIGRFRWRSFLMSRPFAHIDDAFSSSSSRDEKIFSFFVIESENMQIIILALLLLDCCCTLQLIVCVRGRDPSSALYI